MKGRKLSDDIVNEYEQLIRNTKHDKKCQKLKEGVDWIKENSEILNSHDDILTCNDITKIKYYEFPTEYIETHDKLIDYSMDSSSYNEFDRILDKKIDYRKHFNISRFKSIYSGDEEINGSYDTTESKSLK